MYRFMKWLIFSQKVWVLKLKVNYTLWQDWFFFNNYNDNQTDCEYKAEIECTCSGILKVPPFQVPTFITFGNFRIGIFLKSVD